MVNLFEARGKRTLAAVDLTEEEVRSLDRVSRRSASHQTYHRWQKSAGNTMSSSVRKCRGGARRSAPVGCCGSRAGLLPLVQGSVETVEGVWTEVQIRWKPILDQLVAALGGSSPMYTTEETHDIMFQQRVTFTIPLDRSGMEWDNVSVTGVKCLSECEAQTEAAATALQRFACGIYNTKVMDISQCQYEKLRMSCQNTVVKAREQHLALDMILSSWLNCTQQIDRTYRSLFPIPSQYVYGESDNIIIKLKTKLSKQLQTLVTLNYERHNTLLSRAEARKKYQENVCVSTQRYFDEYVIPRDERRQGESAREVKISMQITLFEMMISLGWDEPEYSPLWRVGNVYAYSVELQPSGDDSERILIEGADEASEEKAMESVAKQAILQLEERR
ncbi:hypothetical protein ACQ4PT_058747 [Festuca glaucescens]